MNDIIQALLSAVETREIDLGECSELYTGVVMRLRVNWTRMQKKQRFNISRELGAILEAQKEENCDMVALNKRGDENAIAWVSFWADVFSVPQDEMQQLYDGFPPLHWNWLIGRATNLVNEYEATETKKVAGLLGRSSEEPERNPPTSGTGSQSPDG